MYSTIFESYGEKKNNNNKKTGSRVLNESFQESNCLDEIFLFCSIFYVFANKKKVTLSNFASRSSPHV